ncbi:MAG: hypothetical protein U0232_22635 [Thermomicrobiales bacterium]
MSRRSNSRPPLHKPRVILASDPARCRPARTLIRQASRALYIARRDDEAAALRDQLLAADPADHRRILRTFVDFWPTGQDARHPIGDPADDWASARIPACQRRKAP